jgi:hypothetical protein
MELWFLCYLFFLSFLCFLAFLGQTSSFTDGMVFFSVIMFVLMQMCRRLIDQLILPASMVRLRFISVMLK